MAIEANYDEATLEPSVVDDPRRMRWVMVALMMAFAFVSHFNRASMAAAGDNRIMAQYGISPERMGLVYSAFLFTYTIFMIPGGLLIDRVGAKSSLMLVGFGSGLFVAMTGLVGFAFHDAGSLLLGLLAVRGLMGIFSAPLHPSLARMVGNWVVPEARSRTNGLVNGTALFGIACTPTAFSALIGRFGWPSAFLIMAGVTAAVTLAWSLLASEHPTPAGATGPGKGLASAKTRPVPFRLLLSHRGLVFLTLSYAAVGYFQYLFVYWTNYYFQDVLKLPPETSHWYAAIPPLAMAIGMPLGGWFSDQLERAWGRRRSFGLVPMVGMTAGAVFLILGAWTTNPAWGVTCFGLALGAVGMTEGPFWAMAVEMGGRRGGSSSAFFNFGGNIGGILAPVVTPIVGERFGWSYALALGGVISLGGVALCLCVDPEQRLDEGDDALA